MPSRTSLMQILVYIAYGFFLCIGLMMLYTGLTMGKFSTIGFAISGIFIMQFIYRKPLINLIVGILSLFFSIWMLLMAMSAYNMLDKNAASSTAGTTMVVASITGIALSVLLMFSYGKLGRKDR